MRKMTSGRLSGLAGAIAPALVLAAGASIVHAQCSGFTITSSTGASIVPGTTDTNNHADIMEIRKTFYQWFHRNEDKEQFERAEIKRMKLIKSKKLGPEFTAKPHSNAIYTSRTLNSLISKALSINSSATSTYNMQGMYCIFLNKSSIIINFLLYSFLDYITKEIDFDINIQRY